MRRVFLFLIVTLLWPLVAQTAEDVEGKIFYTTANIWYEDEDKIESTNYHVGQILRVGTKVTITKVWDGSRPVLDAMDPDMWQRYIKFVDDDNVSYRFMFISRHAAAGTSVWDLFNQYFSQKDPMAEGGAFSSLRTAEQKMVKVGEIAPGMSKAAVIMAYGYPPGHKTASVQQNKWIYWLNLFKKRIIYFSDDIVIRDSEAIQPASPIEACIKACRQNTDRTSEQCFDDCRPK